MKGFSKAIAAFMLMTVVVLAVGCKKETSSNEQTQQPEPVEVKLAKVSTSNVTNVTESTARAGGFVLSDGNGSIIERGVCWSVSGINPSINEYHVAADTACLGGFYCEITGLEKNKNYDVRAYVLNEAGINYGDKRTFSTRLK